MRPFFSMLSLIFGLAICSGCGLMTAAPEELRNLIPVTVTIIDGTQPLEGVAVTLSNKGSQGAYACNGVTDGKGVAQIRSTRSSYTGNGVPVGTYSVVLLETVEIPEDLAPQESDQDLAPAVVAAKQAKLNEFLIKNQVIPQKLTLASTSPVELVVEASGATVEIDISQHR